MDKSICVFGDSTEWGAWDKEKGGWVNRLWLSLSEKYSGTDVYNLSVSGGTVETILARFESEARIREANVLIFKTGGNDSAYEHSEGNYLVAPDTFRSKLKEVIIRAKNITPDLIFIGSENCDESRTMPVSWIDIYYTNANIETYNKIMKEICEENKVLFLDIFGLLDNSDLEDGLHPNAVGHEKIFQSVKDFLVVNNFLPKS